MLAELSEAFSDDADPAPPADPTTTAVDDADPVPPADRTTIAIGGDDELDDIAYLDELVAADDDSGTVFIDDEGRSDAMQASAAAHAVW